MFFMHNVSGWWPLVWGLGMLIFWGGLAALIVWGITRLARRDDPRTKPPPLDIAKERYAMGDITKEQFEQIKKDLS